MSKKNDRTLRFYHEVLGLDYLHYGIWDMDDELTIDNLKKAQQKYEDYIIENIPQDTKKILDVGCGTSALAERLLEMGKEAEGLSPDINQKKIFTEKLDAPFHHCRFEKFSASHTYDCLIMSESSQYISIKTLFENVRQSLAPYGHLLVFDYFLKNNATGIFSKSGHNLEAFLKAAQDNNFKIIKQNDFTEQASRTLDLAKSFLDKIELAIDIYTERPIKRHPYLSRLAKWLLRNKINKYNRQKQLIDSEGFKENKAYNFYLFQLQS